MGLLLSVYFKLLVQLVGITLLVQLVGFTMLGLPCWDNHVGITLLEL